MGRTVEKGLEFHFVFFSLYLSLLNTHQRAKSMEFKAKARSSIQFSWVTQSCLTLCNPMDCSTPGFPVLHYLLQFAQTHIHWVGDTIQPSHPLVSPDPALNLLPSSESYPVSRPFASVGQSTGLPYSVKNKRPDKKFRQGLYWGFYCSKGKRKQISFPCWLPEQGGQGGSVHGVKLGVCTDLGLEGWGVLPTLLVVVTAGGMLSTLLFAPGSSWVAVFWS